MGSVTNLEQTIANLELLSQSFDAEPRLDRQDLVAAGKFPDVLTFERSGR